MEQFKKDNENKNPIFTPFEIEKLKGYPFFKNVESFQRYIKLDEDLDKRINDLFKKIKDNDWTLNDEIEKEYRAIYADFEEVDNFYLFLIRDDQRIRKESKKRGRKRKIKMSEEEKKEQENLTRLEQEFRQKHIEVYSKIYAVGFKISSENKKITKYDLTSWGIDIPYD